MRKFIFLSVCLFVAGDVLAQMPEAQKGRAPLAITMQVLLNGSILPDGALVPSPADLFIHPELQTTMSVHAGDAVNIDFLADGKTVCSGKAVWQRPVIPQAGPGQARPQYLAPAEFRYPNCYWTNVPVGGHVFSVRAYGFHGWSAVSSPQRVTILPPLPRQPPSGTHTLTGEQRAALKPEQVQIFQASPPEACETVGRVTARVSGRWPQAANEAFAELKIQAAQLGANGVIVERVRYSNGTPFSGSNRTFVAPAVYLSGRAIYLGK